ncbi:MAG: nucleotidyltransferase domain-containing protein [Planctomycetota bacterium]
MQATDQAAIRDFCDRWGIAELSLFGSTVRGDARPDSDVDILVAFRSDADWDYWNWPEMLDELREIFRREVDLVVKEAVTNPFRRQRILAERRVLYAA